MGKVRDELSVRYRRAPMSRARLRRSNDRIRGLARRLHFVRSLIGYNVPEKTSFDFTLGFLTPQAFVAAIT